MINWLLTKLKKICKYIIPIILAGVIWELFRPIYSASVSAIGQAGNFFVNLFYSNAAKISTSTIVCFLANTAVSFLLSLLWLFFYKASMKIKRIEGNEQEEVRHEKDKTGSLKKIKFLIWFTFCWGTLSSVIFYIYILLPFQLKDSFDHKITTLQAIIPMEQIYKINARWCLMRSRKDYLRLKADIKEIEDKHKDDLEHLSSGK